MDQMSYWMFWTEPNTTKYPARGQDEALVYMDGSTCLVLCSGSTAWKTPWQTIAMVWSGSLSLLN